VITVHTSADQHNAHGAPGIDQRSDSDPDDRLAGIRLSRVIANAFKAGWFGALWLSKHEQNPAAVRVVGQAQRVARASAWAFPAALWVPVVDQFAERLS
jgi:hypothetical protein